VFPQIIRIFAPIGERFNKYFNNNKFKTINYEETKTSVFCRPVLATSLLDFEIDLHQE
jgi:hypothetical protein